MPCKNEGANLRLLARKIKQTSYIFIVSHIVQTGILYMIVRVVHCTILVVISHIGNLVDLKLYDHFMTDGCDVSCSKKISIL